MAFHRLSALLPKRRNGRVAAVLLVLFSGALIAFFWMRMRDRQAWPAPLPDVLLDVSESPLSPDQSNAWDLLSGLAPTNAPYMPPGPDLLADLLRFEALGLAAAASFPELERRIAAEPHAFEIWREAASLDSAWATLDDIESQVPVLLRIVELARLSAYPTSHNLQQGRWDAAVDSWLGTLRIADHVTRGQGSLGLFVALHLTVGVSREILLACDEHEVPAEAALRLLDGLRKAEGAVAPLAEALRSDRAMAHRALSALHTPRSSSMAADIAKRHPPHLALRIARALGSSPEQSAAHLDAICSHAIAAADRPYSSQGLFAGLPRWCSRNGRAPWTHDPLGALASSLFIRNTAAAIAYHPNRVTELRAARITLALHLARERHPERIWPESLEILVQGGLDDEALADPFSADGSRFVYRLAEDQWILYSVGVDQEDHGGANDWLTSGNTREADLVYTSAERARRVRAWQESQDARPAPPTAATRGS